VKLKLVWKVLALVLVIGVGGVLTKGALDYTSGAEFCGTICHTMEGQYERWGHSSHRVEDGCISCHLPHDNFINYLVRKTTDGMYDVYSFTLKDPPDRLQISQRGADLVVQNCQRCHENLIMAYNVAEGRYCWDCHRGLPHGF